MKVSENLNFPVDGRWHIKGHPSGYLGLLKQWFDCFGLHGEGLTIGEPGTHGKAAKKALEAEYAGAKVRTVDLHDADIVWDITKPYDGWLKVNWIICQATLEHVKDPTGAMRNMADVLRKGGKLFLHTVGPAFKYHRHPIDCFRYFRDALIAFGECADLEVIDIYWDPTHCFAAYSKKV